jgi:hypothetical protein
MSIGGRYCASATVTDSDRCTLWELGTRSVWSWAQFWLIAVINKAWFGLRFFCFTCVCVGVSCVRWCRACVVSVCLPWMTVDYDLCVCVCVRGVVTVGWVCAYWCVTCVVLYDWV